jgi:colanic acid/amylovoran biosynthesis glycosyltransferase
LFVVGSFPAISNPFILNQITGLIDLGHDVSIFSLKVNDQQCEHSEVAGYNLHDKLYVPKQLGASTLSRIKYVAGGGTSLLLKRPEILLKAIRMLLSGSPPLSFRFFHQLNTAANFPRNDFDIIHAQFGHLGNMAMLLRGFGVLQGKLVTQFRGFDVSLAINSEGKHYYDALFQSGELFLPVCDYIRRKVIALGAPEEKTCVQYSGVELDKFEYRKRNFHKRGPLKIGSIGRLSEKKGYEYVIRALSILKIEGFDFSYEIVGDGELKSDISEMIKSYGLNRKVTLLGSRNHDFIANFLHDVDIFISHNVTAESGDQEGIPNTLKEAMLSGAPVFSTYHAGIPEIISDEVSGFLTEEKNIRQLVDKLKKFAFPLRNLESITLNAREIIVTMFDNDQLNVDLVHRYYSILH